MDRVACASEPLSGDERRSRLEAAKLYLIVDARPNGAPAAELVEAALDGGVDVVQLREKAADDHLVLETAGELRKLCHARGGLLIVNDRPDLAAACGADGVHLGQDDLRPDEARAAMGRGALVGVSTHSPQQIAAAQAARVDYIGVGPVFSTPTKPDAPAVGVELVRHAAQHTRMPFFAIGGIDASNAATVRVAGARRIAVVRAIRDADDPRAAAAALRAAVVEEAQAGAAR